MRTSRPHLRAVLAVAVVVVLGVTGCTPDAEPAPTADATGAPASPTSAPAPTPTAAADPLPDGAVTALLLGTDSRTPGAFTGQADTIMLAQISAQRDSLALISITRDSWVDIPGYGPGKLNSAFARGGTDLMQQTVSQLFGGLEIDYVVQTDFEGFIGITRALDGFMVDNVFPTSVTVQSTGRVVEFGAGPILLESTDGLIYVRQRYGLPQGDLDRAERQRAAIIGMLDRLDAMADDPAALAVAMTHIASRVQVTGDLTLDDMIALVALSEELTQQDIVSLMAPIEGFGTQAGQSVNVVDVARTAAMGAALRAGDLSDYVATYGTEY